MNKKNIVFRMFLILAVIAFHGTQATTAAAQTPAGVTRYAVAEHGLESGTCTSWATACSLPYALAQAASGDSVWAKAGTYTPGLTQSATFTIKSGVALYGGFSGTETLLSQRQLYQNPTILSGDIGVLDDSSDNVYHVVTAKNVDDATLDGLWITGGNAALGETRGGGLLADGGSLTLKKVFFYGNNAATSGGGLAVINRTSVSGQNLAFAGNSAVSKGGALTVEGKNAYLTLRFASFGGNRAPAEGAISMGTGNLTISDSIIWGGLTKNKKSLLYVYNSIMLSPCEGAVCDGIIYSAPLFTNVNGPDGISGTADDNLRLRAGSPALNASTDLNPPTVDLDGFTRPADGSADLGAYENQPAVSSDQSFEAVAGYAMSGQLSASDPNGDPVLFTLVGPAPAGSFTLNSNGSFSYTSPADAIDPVTFQFSVKDAKTISSAGPYTATIYFIPPDQQPLFSLSRSLVQVDEEFATTEVVTVTPETEASATYSLSPASVDFANVAIDPADGTVTITGKPDRSGTQVFTLTAIAGEYTYSQLFTLDVVDVNDAPVFTLDPTEVTVTANFAAPQQVRVIPGFVPQEEQYQQPIYNLSPASVTFATVEIDPETGTVTITAVLDATGTQVFTITADDGEAANNLYSQDFTLSVGTDPTPTPTVDPSATPTPTVDPSATPTPTVDPSATPTPTVDPSATPTPTVDPSATPTPTVDPSATPTPTVDPSATPTPTVDPSATPTPTVDPSATPTPTVDPSATPTPEPVPDFYLSDSTVTLKQDFTSTRTVFVIEVHPELEPVYSITNLDITIADVSIDPVTGEISINSIPSKCGTITITVSAQAGSQTYEQNFDLIIEPVIKVFLPFVLK